MLVEVKGSSVSFPSIQAEPRMPSNGKCLANLSRPGLANRAPTTLAAVRTKIMQDSTRGLGMSLVLMYFACKFETCICRRESQRRYMLTTSNISGPCSIRCMDTKKAKFLTFNDELTLPMLSSSLESHSVCQCFELSRSKLCLKAVPCL